MFLSVPTALRCAAWLGCATVIGMILIFLATGVGQDPLQFVHAPPEYARLLLANPAALRASVGLDNLFIIFYTTCFVLLGDVLPKRGSPVWLVRIAVGLLVALAFLDMAENFHFLTMLAGAEQGITPSPAEIGLQVWESLFKFHVSYLGLFLLGLALPRATPAERLLANLTLFMQAPVGILIYVAPREIAVPLLFVRFAYFLVSLALVGAIYGAGATLTKRAASGSGAPA